MVVVPTVVDVAMGGGLAVDELIGAGVLGPSKVKTKLGTDVVAEA